jgi:hypothetical protein
VCAVVVEEASREGGGRGFESRGSRSDATLHGWLVGRIPSLENFFAIYFELFNAIMFFLNRLAGADHPITRTWK